MENLLSKKPHEQLNHDFIEWAKTQTEKNPLVEDLILLPVYRYKDDKLPAAILAGGLSDDKLLFLINQTYKFYLTLLNKLHQSAQGAMDEITKQQK